MKDPLVHAEKCLVPGFGAAAFRNAATAATGLAGDLPKTVGTGCERRRPLAVTSMVPEHVTCLPCRQYAAAELERAIASGESLLSLPEDDWHLVIPGSQRTTIIQMTGDYRALLARYERMEK